MMKHHLPRMATQALTLTVLSAACLLTPTSGAQDESSGRSSQPDSLERQVKGLLNEINRQQIEIEVLRSQLAEAQLLASRSERDLAELQKFIEDYQQLGSAYEEYQGVKEASEREARQRQAMEARARYEQIKTERRQRYEQARTDRNARKAETSRLERYRKAGFSSLGLDVYASRFSYFYHTNDATRSRIDYAYGFGNYLRLYPNYEIDYSDMTISGSVLNASDEVRNIGVAITFFDESGNQVGHEIIKVTNARPDVPYPFTADVKMAINRPFDTSSSYVLYADPVEGGEAEPSAPLSPPDDADDY